MTDRRSTKKWTIAQAIEAYATDESREAAREFEADHARCLARLESKAARFPAVEERNAKMRRGFAALSRKFGYWPPEPSKSQVSSKNPRIRGLMEALRSGQIVLSGLRDSIVGPRTNVRPDEFGAAEWEFQPRACGGAGLARRIATRSAESSLTYFYCEVEPPGARRGPKDKYDWPAVERKVFQLLDARGNFMPNDLEWTQAKLEESISSFMAEFRVYPSESHLRAKLKQFRENWLRQKADN